MKQLTMGSLFSGIGGFEEAARRNGIHTLWNCEIDEDKRRILKRHFPDAHQYADIRDVHHPEHVDILAGGFPCQDLSVAQQNNKGGAKGINGERSGLWKEYARILGEIRPSVVIFENSPMLLVRGFERVLGDFSRFGYAVEWRCFYASQFGYPHGRKRVYGVAYSLRDGLEVCLQSGGCLQKVLPERKPSRQAFSPMPPKRYDRHSDYSSVRMDDGFRKGLDKRRIHGCGNAVVVDIPQAIFHTLLQYWP